MKNSHITVSQVQIDRRTSIEIEWNVAEATLTIFVFRVHQGIIRNRLIPEAIGPFGSVGEMRNELHIRFDGIVADRLCRPNP